MTDACVCSAAGFCARRQCRIPELHWWKCQAGQVAAIDLLYKQPDTRPQHPTQRKPQSDVSTVGTELTAVIETALGTKITCGTCLSYLRSLNRTTAHAHAQIVTRLNQELPIPIEIRRTLKTREAILAWIAEMVGKAVPNPEPQITYESGIANPN